MKVKYINGKKVYVEDENGMAGMASNWSRWDDTIQVCKHRDVIHALNRLFKQAEDNPEEVNHSLWNLIHSMNLHFDIPFRVPVEIINKEITEYDDFKKIPRKKEPRLYVGTHNKVAAEKLKVHNGGLYKPSECPTYQADDLLSDEFKAWQREQRTKPDHHDNA